MKIAAAVGIITTFVVLLLNTPPTYLMRGSPEPYRLVIAVLFGWMVAVLLLAWRKRATVAY